MKRANYVLLLCSLACAALGVTALIVLPEGFTRVRGEPRVQHRYEAPSDEIRFEGFGADRRGGVCGVRVKADHSGRRQLQLWLPECTSYAPPEVVRLGDRIFVVWEWSGTHVAVSVLRYWQYGGIRMGHTVRFRRPRDAGGTYLPRDGVRSLGDELLITYAGGHALALDPHLERWPRGSLDTTTLILGPSLSSAGWLGASLVLLVLLLGLGRLAGPRRLAGALRRGAAHEVALPADGSCPRLGGEPLRLDRAQRIGTPLDQYLGSVVTVLVGEERRATDAAGPYRESGHRRVVRVWTADARGARALSVARQRVAIASVLGVLGLLSGVLIALVRLS